MFPEPRIAVTTGPRLPVIALPAAGAALSLAR